MKILLAVDGSTGAQAAVRHALGLVARGLRATFVLANVQEPASLYEIVVAHDADVLSKVRGAAGADLLLAAEALLEGAGAAFETEVAGGDPANLLAELAENYGCGLIVMGARGMGHPDSGGLGTVAHAVLLHAPVPVTVVRDADVETLSRLDGGDDSATG